MNSVLRLVGIAAIICFAAASEAFAACDLATVKQQIDLVLDKNPDLGARFRREVKEGADSLTVVEDMSSPETRDMLGACRWDAAEYLSKRGFPPAH